MKYAIYLPNFGPYADARTLASLAREAEQAGWDGFFLWDHVANRWVQPMVDPWVALAAVALSTQRLRIGTTVTPLPRRRPWKLARETVSIDRLSGGRLTLGVGTGQGGIEWDDLSEQVDQKMRAAMLDEGLEVLAGLWSGKPFKYAGRHYRVEGAQFLPTPLQAPRIPVWVGGFWPHKAPFRRAARWDGMFPLFRVETEEEELAQLQEAVAFVMDQRQEGGPFDIVVTGVTPGDRLEQAAEIVGQREMRGATWWLEGIAPYRFGLGFEGEWPVEALRERVFQGPPQI